MSKHITPSYRIIKTEEFIQKSVEIGKAYKRTPELIQAIEWSLCRKPHSYQSLTNDFYFWVTEELSNDEFPTVRIVYRISTGEQTVVLIDIDEA